LVDVAPWVAVIEPPGLNDRVVQILIEALYKIDLDWLQSHPRAPRLYESGVRYRAEPQGVEKWRAIPWVLELGQGDCEDLACWLAAEYTVRGIQARPVAHCRRRRNRRTYHILVQLPDGTLEDPSKKLGM